MTKGKLRDRKETLKLKEDREERSVFFFLGTSTWKHMRALSSLKRLLLMRIMVSRAEHKGVPSGVSLSSSYRGLSS